MLTLIIGVPNAGKTTYSDKNFENVLHMDDLVSEGKHTAYVIDCIENCEGDICVEGVYYAPGSRKRIADAYNGYKQCIWLDTPIDECKRRENRRRPLFIIDNSYRMFKPPTLDEGWDEVIIIRPDGEEHLVKGE